LTAAYGLRPTLGLSALTICAPALLACGVLGGAGAALTATLILTFGSLVLARLTGLPVLQTAFVTAALGALGLLLTAFLRRVTAHRIAVAEILADQADRESLLQASLETVADALVLTDDRGEIQSFSRAAERLFGWTAAEIVGQPFRRLTPMGEADVLDASARGSDDGDSYRQVTGVKKDGAQFPMEVRVGEVSVGGRRLFTLVIHDMTSAQEAERRAEELRAQLTQVWAANSMGEMASVLAHELNQPLSAVANYLRAARNIVARLEVNDDDLIDAVARAGDQAVRAGEIIRTMRDLAARGGTLQKPESLSAMIGEVDFIISLMAREANARVSYDLYRGDDTVMADRIQLQQLIVNLARNAIEAVTKYPNREIKISTRLESDESLITTVEDSGPGIDEAVADRLFQPLASTKPEGMGLGLSISSAIVHNHRGRIWAESSRLGGAAFSFLLARVGVDGDVSGRTDGVRRR
jgi:two-component system sensor kinase FixL